MKHGRIDLGGDRIRVRRSRLAEIQLTSTSDIAFLLLIFFLASAVFVSQMGLPLVLPPAGSSPMTVSESEVVVLRISAAGDASWRGEPVSASELAGWARTREAETAGRIYVLSVEGGCPYDAVVRTIDGLRSAAVERISFRLDTEDA